MEQDINQLALSGEIYGSPELTEMPNGCPRLRARLLVRRKYRSREKSTEWKTEKSFFDIYLWQQLAIDFADIKAGQKVFLTGSLQSHSWRDDNGQNQFKTVIQVRNMVETREESA